MSNATKSLGLIVATASLALIVIGMTLLPWVTAGDGATSFTALQILTLDDTDETVDSSVLERTDFPASYNAVITTSDGVTQEIPAETRVRFTTAPYAPNTLWILVTMSSLAAICLAVAYVLVRGRKDAFISFIVWTGVTGIYGVMVLLFIFSLHTINFSTNRSGLRASLINQVEGATTNEAETNIDTEVEVEVDLDEVIPEDVTVRSVNLTDFAFTSDAKPNLGLGAWLTLLGFIGVIAQVFIKRDTSSEVNLRTGERTEAGSGVVQTYGARVQQDLISQFVVSAAVIFAILPVVFILSSAFNPSGNLSTRSLIPQGIEQPSDLLLNFRALLIDEVDLFPFPRWVMNSFIVATTTTVLGVFITAMSAYAFSRFRFMGRRQLLLGILLMQVFPNLLAMVALFLILQQVTSLADGIPQVLPFLSFIDWSWIEVFGLDSLGGLILVYLGGVMGINTWLMKGFFDSIPRDIDESALVDGATHWQIFWMLILPLVRPILAVVGILSFVGTFNEFVLARVLLRDKENWTLMVGLFNFINVDFNADWGKFAAGALLSSIPVVVIYIALQDQIVGGLTAGSVKG